MKALNKTVFAVAALFAGFSFVACDDANEYEDAYTQNPGWAGDYNDTLKIAHPETIANTYWVRGSGLKYNTDGEEIQGYVESLDFVDEQYVVVKMSEGIIPASIKNSATWLDDSNTEAIPQYEYTYSPITGTLEILKIVVDSNGKVSKVNLFTAVVVSEKQEVLTIAHFGDTPVQTYLVKGQKPA